MQTLETRKDYDIKRYREENSNLQFENQNLKEKLTKAGIIIKQTMSELEDLKRERNLTKNTIEFSKYHESRIREDNNSLKDRIVGLEVENSNLRDKIIKYQDNQEKIIDGLITLDTYLPSSGQDSSIIKSKINYLVNIVRIGMDPNMKSSGLFSSNSPLNCSYFEYRSNSGLSERLSSSVATCYNYRTHTCSRTISQKPTSQESKK